MFARGPNHACSAAGAIAWLCGRSRYVTNAPRNKGERNHWRHLRVYGQRIFDQSIAALPCFAKARPDAGSLGFGAFASLCGGKSLGFELGKLQYRAVTDEVGDAKVGQTGLARTEKFAGSAHGQIEFGLIAGIAWGKPVGK